jgi:hypothetical protein
VVRESGVYLRITPGLRADGVVPGLVTTRAPNNGAGVLTASGGKQKRLFCLEKAN